MRDSELNLVEAEAEPESQTAVPPIRCDPKDYTPEYAQETIDYNVFDRVGATFTHREKTVKIDRMKSYCMAAIENEAISENTTTLPRQKTLQIVCNALRRKHSEWFNAKGGYSQSKLQTSQIIEDYFNGEIAVEPVDGDDINSIRTVVIPVLGIILNKLETHKKADREAEINQAQSDIKHAVIEKAQKHNLSEEQINKAVTEAVDILNDKKD